MMDGLLVNSKEMEHLPKIHTAHHHTIVMILPLMTPTLLMIPHHMVVMTRQPMIHTPQMALMVTHHTTLTHRHPMIHTAYPLIPTHLMEAQPTIATFQMTPTQLMVTRRTIATPQMIHTQLMVTLHMIVTHHHLMIHTAQVMIRTQVMILMTHISHRLTIVKDTMDVMVIGS